MIARVLLSIASAALLTLGLLWSLIGLTTMDSPVPSVPDTLQWVDFVRIEREEVEERKKREKPTLPEPEKPSPRLKLDIAKPDTKIQVQHVEIPLALNLPLDLSLIDGLNDARVDTGGEHAVNANVIPLVRVDPIYPRRARSLQKEGVVELEFTITTEGRASDIVVTRAEPAELFNRSAIHALRQWRFRPKSVGGQFVAERASVSISFKLEQ